jgi:hypothetical protein
MQKPMIWLLAGAATLTLTAGAAALAGEPQDAARDAARDSQSAPAAEKGDRHVERREQREVRVYRRGDSDRDLVIMRGGDDRAEHLSDLLQLRPDQEPALKAFLEATRPNRDHVHDHMVSFDREGGDRTTLQRLDEMQARAAEQQAEMSRKIAAIKTFYGQLDARQKKAFDAMPMLMMVGPNIGPMMIPHPMPIMHRMPVPPVPPVPPLPPLPPRS